MKARLDELSDHQDRLERIVKDLRLEWDEMYDKMRLLFARASKRIRDAAELEEAPAPAEEEKTPSHVAPQSTIRSQLGYGHLPVTHTRRNY